MFSALLFISIELIQCTNIVEEAPCDMDWLEFQLRIRRLHDFYFRDRRVSRCRAESARNKDTGEQAKRIDDAILDLYHKGRCDPLSEDEKDMLAVRLNWAWRVSLARATAPFDPSRSPETLSVSDFGHVLITLWRTEGRESYEPWIVERLGPDGNRVPDPPPPPNKRTR
jgi:hypothetical protein